ncbi:MAG: FAD:protein FMN transferase [Firmicutes bacterium]|nr:FAD:protein FMN transferase [Bacillota bacterium]
MNRKANISSRLLKIILALSVLGLLAAGGCRFYKKPVLEDNEDPIRGRRVLMDTVVEIRIDGGGDPGLLDRSFQEMERLEGILSRFVPGSDLAQVNAQAGSWVQVDQALADLLALALEAAEISGGAFDPTIGAVIELWGFGSKEPKVPPASELALALKTVDYRQVGLDRAENRVRIPVGTVLDLGGIAKGYIVDQTAKMLRANGVKHAIINAGGDLAVIGARPDGNPWRVGVQDPDQPSEIRWVLPLQEQSVVTSGDYQRFFVEDGKSWHHLLDPKTGYPASGLRSVSVISSNTAYGDALATAIFILGMEKGRQLVQNLPGVEAILMAGEEVWISSGLDLQ